MLPLPIRGILNDGKNCEQWNIFRCSIFQHFKTNFHNKIGTRQSFESAVGISKLESVRGKTRVCCCSPSGVDRSVCVAVAEDNGGRSCSGRSFPFASTVIRIGLRRRQDPKATMCRAAAAILLVTTCAVGASATIPPPGVRRAVNPRHRTCWKKAGRSER